MMSLRANAHVILSNYVIFVERKDSLIIFIPDPRRKLHQLMVLIEKREEAEERSSVVDRQVEKKEQEKEKKKCRDKIIAHGR